MNIDKLIKRKQHARRDNNLRQLAELTNTLGDMYFENERPVEALREYTEQLAACEELRDRLSCAIAHRMIGEVHASLGEYEQALVHQNLHLEGARDMRNSIEEQRALATLGRTHFCLAESLIGKAQKRDEALANAKAAYAQSMELCDKLTASEIKLEEKTLMRARLLLNLGLTLEAQRETQQAINLIEQATALCVSNNFQEDLHRTCISLAAIYERQGNLELALSYIDTAATVSDARLRAEARVTKAELFMRTGQWIETRKVLVSLYTSSGLPRDINCQVEKYLRIIVTICRAENSLLVETNVRAKQRLYETLGDAAVAAQCFDKGVEYYRHMLTCAEETGEQIGVSLTSLVQTLKDAGRYKEALPLARRELELCASPREKCRSALFLADLLVTANAADAEIRDSYTLALSSANESGNVKLQKSVVRELVSYLRSAGQLDEAEDTKRRAGLTSEVPSDTESEVSSEENGEIGADICLEDLSDLEVEEVDKRPVGTKRRSRRVASAIKRNEKGETQLHVACINGDLGAVERLLSSGHSTNVRDHYGWSPLHEAANHGYVDIAELLLKHGASVNDPGGASCKGVTPLHDAAYCGHFSMMQLLMQHGATVTLRTHDGDTVLDCLEDWRDRVEDLSPTDLVEYETLRNKLSAVIPVKKRRKRSSDDVPVERSASPETFEARRISAGEDYKRTIASLRTFNKTNAVSAFKGSNEPVAPLVSEEQVLVDDWLEDDIGSAARKKSASNSHTAAIKRKYADGNLESAAKKMKPYNAGLSRDDFSTSEDSDSAADVCQLFERAKRSRRKRQTSLLSSGFTVSRTPSPEAHPQSPPHTTTSSKQYDKEYVHLRMSVKERVFNLKVAVCEDETEFLAYVKSTAERVFHEETGCTVKLLLRPVNGAVATKENILNVARENEKLECEIVELQVPSVVERYKTVCSTHHLTPCEVMLKCLKSCENTSIFRVKPDDIDKQLLVPLLKTLEYEKSVKVLQLSGTVLLSAGAHLHQCLSNLSSLQELYLKGCDIDFACLRQVNSLPAQLRVLDLSYNPLSSESRDTLRKLIAPLRYLQTLNLRYCTLEDFYLPLDHNLNLTSCDISWNKLNRDAASSFLSRQLFDLNLSNVLSSNRFISSLDTINVALSPSIESLDLSFCDVTDSDVRTILKQLPRLLKFILSGNINVSVLSVNMLLSRQPTLAYVDVSGCKNIASNPEAGLVIQNPKVCTLLASIEPNLCDAWIKLWRGTGIVTKLPHNLAIFKPT
ncbi:PREDICTED: tonsoku-like protein [Vollenhovia emeryi]|uniref:tonsoku-like protein n=1 Tax=Vollenhovia emeryi TaxID=411798 RepID=UPI0005F3EE7B|nr:PREDICTED: tonsoku-like protein [Vollenhovia emeryi]